MQSKKVEQKTVIFFFLGPFILSRINYGDSHIDGFSLNLFFEIELKLKRTQIER